MIYLFCVLSGTVSSIIKNPRIENIIAQIFPIIIIFAVYFVVFKIFRNYSFNSDKTLKDEITLTLTESGINYASFRGSFNYTVGDFRKIIINKHLIAIYISFSKAILIPKHFFNSKEEENEVELFIKRNFRRLENKRSVASKRNLF